MAQSSLTPRLLDAKRAKNLSFEQLGELLGQDETWVAGLFYGQATATPGHLDALSHALDIPRDELAPLLVFPADKGSLGQTVPTDPLVYRFYEIIQIYGLPLKAVIQEKFGDGIMSAIDFSMKVEKEQNPAGDRVILTLNGKFLPYRRW
jgi:cyanate lyase